MAGASSRCMARGPAGEAVMCSPTEAFECANRCLGWGDPNGGLWFIAHEEADDFDADCSREEIIEWYAKEGNPEFLTVKKKDWSKERNGRPIRAYTSKIAKEVSQEGRDMTWRDYLDQHLWRSGYQVCQVNLYPLGKRTVASWSKAFKGRYGYGADDRKDYENRVGATRFQRLRELRREYRPQALVCFGRWSACQEVFQPNSSPEMLADGVYVYEADSIIRTPHFSRGMSNAKAELVSARLRKWGVSIP